jgi:hypothetical protein
MPCLIDEKSVNFWLLKRLLTLTCVHPVKGANKGEKSAKDNFKVWEIDQKLHLTRLFHL